MNLTTLIKNFGAHGIAYLVSALTLVSTLPAPVVALLGPHAAVIVGSAGLLLTLIHNISTVLSPPTTASNAAATAVANQTVIKAILLLPFVAMLLSLAGCSTLASALGTPTAQQQLIASGVELAEVAYLSKQSTPATDANAITTGCEAVEAVAPGSSFTSAAAQQTLAADLAMTKLTAPQQIALSNMVSSLNAVVTSLTAAGKLSGSEAVSLGNVCGWLIVGAAPYTTVSAT